MAQYPQRIGEADCRDYLRTGRCKYGESCKYHHPPNVQSGGGIKTPLNPSEPPFPIRPNEPPCQYYLKHGTCKFGQTCKFHHPPNMVVGGGANGLPGTVLVNVGGMNLLAKPGMQRGGGQQILLSTGGADTTEQSQQGAMLQILPQRPNEPDCIYFLRNGRCKYGATCKYHHPMSTATVQQVELAGSGRKQQTIQLQLQPQARSGRGRSHSTGSVSDMNNIRAVQLFQQSTAGHGHHGQLAQSQQYVSNSGVGPTHILVADGPIAVMAVDQGGPAPAPYQQVGNVGNQLYTQPEGSVGSDLADNRHEHSPQMTASVASSYETAVSSYEYMAQGNSNQQVPIDTNASGAHWQRTNSQQHLASMGMAHRQGNGALRTSGSGGSLHAYQSADTTPTSQTHGHYGPMSGGRTQMARNSGGMTNDGNYQHPPSSLRRAADAANRSNQEEQERRHRAVSISSVGSTGEASLMYSSVSEEAAGVGHEAISRGWSSSASLPTSAGNVAADRTQTLWEEHNVNTNVGFSQDSAHSGVSDNGLSAHVDQSRKSSSSRPRSGNNNAFAQQEKQSDPDDDGLSMMTSALLNMLDTPDEDGNQRYRQRESVTGTDFYADSTSYHGSISASHRKLPSSAPGTPTIGSINRPRATSLVDESAYRQHGMNQYSQMPLRSVHSSQILEVDFGGNSMPSYHQAQYPEDRFSLDAAGSDQSSSPSDRANALPSRWSPTLYESNSSAHQLERNAQSVSALQQPPSAPPSASQGPPNIGLFLS